MDIPAYLEGTKIGQRIKALLEIYDELDTNVDLFVSAPNKRKVACPSGCGRCCLGFDPPVMGVEAQTIAACGTRDIPAKSPETPSGTCIYYDPHTPFHCKVYAVRPLVCRGFGYSLLEDKNSQAVFQFCKHMPTEGERTLKATFLKEAFEHQPPSLTAYGQRMHNQFPEEDGVKLPLSLAIEGAQSKVQMVRNLSLISRT